MLKRPAEFLAARKYDAAGPEEKTESLREKWRSALVAIAERGANPSFIESTRSGLAPSSHPRAPACCSICAPVHQSCANIHQSICERLPPPVQFVVSSPTMVHPLRCSYTSNPTNQSGASPALSGADRQADFSRHAAAASAALPVRESRPRALSTAPAKCVRKFMIAASPARPPFSV
jgi:hypothetical protein